MKKFAVILLINAYALTTLGIGVQQFYCCGKRKSTSLSFVHEVKEKCGMEKSMAGCCKTSFKSIKVKDIHVATDAINVLVKHFTLVQLFTSTFQFIPSVIEPVTIANASHAPPWRHGVHIFIYNCAYLI